MQAHLPAGAHQISSGTARGPGGVSIFFVGYALRAGNRANALPAAQPGATSCPGDLGPLVDLRFTSGGPTPRTLATAKADGGGCRGVSLSIRGRAQPGLSGAPKLIQRLNALLGLELG